MSDTTNPLVAPVRPGSLDVRGQQPTLFPFDAFEFDDPNRTEEPELRLKAPWKMVASSITAEALEAAFISATEIVVGYLGADPDNPAEGDRRLVIRAEVMKLESFNGTTWDVDISLGDYDSSGDFIPFLKASGIFSETSDYSRITKKFSLPNPIQVQRSSTFVNSKDGLDLGEMSVPPGHKHLKTYVADTDIIFDGEAVKTYNINYDQNVNVVSPYRGYSSFTPIVNESFYTIMFEPTVAIGSTQFTYDTYYVDIQDSNRYPDYFWRAIITANIRVNTNTGEIMAVRSVIMYSPTGTTIGSSSSLLDTGLFLTPGINHVQYSYGIAPGMYVTGTTFSNSGARISEIGTTVAVRNASGILTRKNLTSGEYITASVATVTGAVGVQNEVKYGDVHRLYTGTGLTAPSGNPAVTILHGGNLYTHTQLEDWQLDSADHASYLYMTHTEAQDLGLMYGPEYFDDYYSMNESWLTLMDKERDLLFMPSDNFGKVVVLGGANLPESYSGKYITVTGSPGKVGDTGSTGDTGPTGPEGESFFDGGTWDTIYQPDQTIDGGGW